MFKNLSYNIKKIKQHDPAAKSSLEILLLYSGLHAIMHHRLSAWFYRHKLFFIARLISQLSRFFTGIEIHPGAKIGKGVFIDHGMGVVIGETAVVGDDCVIYHGVTLGGVSGGTKKRHPTLENNVTVGAGAKILGSFTVGANSKIAANSVVLKPIPKNATAAGVPAKIVKINGKKASSENENSLAKENLELKNLILNITDRLDKIENCFNHTHYL